MDTDKLAMPEFKELWSGINAKSVCVVDFDADELIQKSIAALNRKLHVSKIHFQVKSGTMHTTKSKEELLTGVSFIKEEAGSYKVQVTANANVIYDLIGKRVDKTALTRKAIVAILREIQPAVLPYSICLRRIRKILSSRLPP